MIGNKTIGIRCSNLRSEGDRRTYPVCDTARFT
jgi:hypothetical protein